eukprot:jgi/Ulvmu1/721/UM010_0093.1
MAGQLRRHARQGFQAGSPRARLRRINWADPAAGIPDLLDSALRSLPEAANVVLASHLRLHEVAPLPPGIIQAVVDETLKLTSGHIKTTCLTQGVQTTHEIDAPGDCHLLQALLPHLPESGLRHLSILHSVPQDDIESLLGTSILSQPSLQTLHLRIAKLPLSTVTRIVSQVSAVTALTLENEEHDADATMPQQPSSLQDVYITDPCPGRPGPIPIFHQWTTRVLTNEYQAAAEGVAQAISQLQHLQHLELKPPLSSCSAFWLKLGQHIGISSLVVAFLEWRTPGLPSPPEQHMSAQHAFAALPSMPALKELQLHARSYDEASEQALLQSLASMPTLTAITLQCRLSTPRVAPLCRTLSAMPALRQLSLLLHPPASLTEASTFSAAFTAAWPTLTALSALQYLSLPIPKLTAAADVFRMTHTHLSAFRDLRSVTLEFTSLTQPNVWLHVAQLTALTALRIGGFMGPAGSMPDVWLQAVATAVCSCTRLQRLEAEDAVDEVLPWLGAHLSQLSNLRDLRVTSARPGAQLSVGALTPAMTALTALTQLHLGSAGGAAPAPQGTSFAVMQQRRAQCAVLLASLAGLTRLEALRLWSVLTAAAGVEEARALGGSLQRLRRLTWLDLSGNSLHPAVLRVLAPHVADACGLLELHLRHTGIGDAGMRVLASAVAALRVLRRLDLRGNGLGSAGAAPLVAATVELPLEEGVAL